LALRIHAVVVLELRYRHRCGSYKISLRIIKTRAPEHTSREYEVSIVKGIEVLL